MTWLLGGVPTLYFVFARLTFHFPMSGLSSAHTPTERTTIATTSAMILAFICFLPVYGCVNVRRDWSESQIGYEQLVRSIPRLFKEGNMLGCNSFTWASARVKISRNKQGDHHGESKRFPQDRSRFAFTSDRGASGQA